MALRFIIFKPPELLRILLGGDTLRAGPGAIRRQRKDATKAAALIEGRSHRVTKRITEKAMWPSMSFRGNDCCALAQAKKNSAKSSGGRH